MVNLIWQFLGKARSIVLACESKVRGAFSSVRSRIRHQIVLKTEYPLVELCDSCAHREMYLSDGLIPPFVFQTWISNKFGRSHYRAIREFRALNPTLDFVLFDDKDAESYLSDFYAGHEILDIYRNSHFKPLKADIFRYCILYQRGGYYFDISKGCSVPLKSLHAASDCRLLSYEASFCSVMPELHTTHCFQYPDRYFVQWGFGFEPKDRILERVINLICAYYPYFRGKTFQNPKSAILAFTGPGMFTKAVREIVKEEGRLEGAQAGVNFNGFGIPWMPGSEVRYHLSPPYVLARNDVIVD